ncbi:hypothetical protein [Labilithrix luteola]|uniref:hypothetical protein n=1 Tax=Labilithrix luteola TaxID=1391654 RepID=UPI0011BA5C75|nr:hypothetical protein [Labilithrix luteola]
MKSSTLARTLVSHRWCTPTLLLGLLATGCSSSDGPAATAPSDAAVSEGDASPPAKANGVKDEGETDIDCGGGAPGVARCSDDKACLVASDCTSGYCNPQNICRTPTGSDQARNGDESDVDCGGATTNAPRCGTDKHCNAKADCESAVCGADGLCDAATSSDTVQNGDESDVDCGGSTTNAPRCEVDMKCKRASDCASLVCGADGLCDAPLGTDSVKNGDESDVDCGGTTTGAPRCGTDKTCNSEADCANKICTAGKCAAPLYTDTVQNGDETDVDCGGDGTVAHACATGKTCKVHSDCSSNGCDFDFKCAPRPSCTAKDGGSTCRKPDGTMESCCKAISIPPGKIGTTTIPAFTVDKYVATAGRMRAFLTRVNGNVRGYIETNTPSWWDPRWTPWLPISFNGHVDNDYAKPVASTTVSGWSPGEYTVSGNNAVTTVAAHDLVVTNINIASAWAQVAGGVIYDQGSQGCTIGTAGVGHPTYDVPVTDAVNIYGENYARWMSTAALDQRPINCTNWPVLAALCAFDGGQLISVNQFNFIYDDDGYSAATSTTTRSTYPWGSPPTLTCSGAIATNGGACCKTNALNADGTCVSAGGTWSSVAGYDPINNPHPGGYATVGGIWTKVGTGRVGFSTSPCPDCVDDFVNWRFNWQDPNWSPWTAADPNEQVRRSRDQSYFISPPGTFPKGASRMFNGNAEDRVQDIAGLVFEAASLAKTASNGKSIMTFGDADASNDIAVSVPAIATGGTGSWEGHAIGSAAGYPLPAKYGKMGVRCVY